ncbi:MAG: type III pantothenate kinase [Chloroflexi bacterium]|nr:type III pantothenate kinase [Chloroflexota bacterium]MBM3155222.1 type III pantothenate kinase [Chloroflexota bacterium]MBM3172548.1 type III pantothenate kinase [Chloroflexota bacterium]MBM3175628.1 type III pantothenate kinase [Chloroflexota bacterium]MBM4450354.1 type III pantothenate kinase [Chloroflexota bacterium]
MLFAADIGNTNITVGVFDGQKLKATWRIATGVHRMPDEYAILILNLLENQGLKSSQITAAVICSVVPPLVGGFEELFRRYLKITPLVVGAGVKTGVRICMDNPREVGADRIVNAVAAHHLYGGPVIVIDLGTATTFDVVSAEGDYVGGSIAPGIAIATEALFTRTAVLPRVELIHPKKAIGRSTVAAMQSGIVYGYVGLIEGLVARIRKELGAKAKVVATGGFAELLASETSVIEVVNPDITLIGLRLIYEMNQQ